MGLRRQIAGAYGREPRLKAFTISFAIFSALTLGVTAIAAHLPVGDASLIHGFWVSLAASFVEDLCFFLLVGAVGIYLTLQKPDDELFERRTSYLFNATRVNEKLRQHLKTKLVPLGLFSTRFDTNIVFTDINEALGAVQATVEVERTIVNMFRDQPFSNEPQGLSILTDQVGDAATVQGQLIAIWGDVRDKEGNIRPPTDIIGPALRENTFINVPANGEGLFRYRFWVWHKRGASYVVEALRYSETVQVRVTNRTHATLKLVSAADSQEQLLTPNMTYPYALGALPSGSRDVFMLKEIIMPKTDSAALATSPGSGA